MKNSLMNLYDKLMLRKRSVIETVNDELKNVCQIEHTRHRSIENFATNLFAGLIAYNLLPKKPSMNIEIIDKSRIIAKALHRTHVKKGCATMLAHPYTTSIAHY